MRIRLFALTLIALSLLSAVHLLEPSRSQAATCSCIPILLSTSTLVGSGTSCSAASTQLATKTDNAAQMACAPDGTCYESAVIVDVACYFDAASGKYKKEGHRDYRCQICN